MILSVDPGINHCGVGLFDGGPSDLAMLRRAWLARSTLGTDWNTLARCTDVATQVVRGLSLEEMRAIKVFIGEWPKIYSGKRGRGKGDPNVSLMPLAGVIAAIAAMLPNTVHLMYLPREWKGTTDGDEFTDVIKSRLGAIERMRIEPCPESLAHNVYDGIGIGLKYLGRLERKRFISRGKPK